MSVIELDIDGNILYERYCSDEAKRMELSTGMYAYQLR